MTRASAAVLMLFSLLASTATGQVTVGAMGDSYSEEYRLLDPNARPEGYYNWVEVLIHSGRADFGPLDTFPEGDPRHGLSGLGYTYNFALAGATTESFLGSGSPLYLNSQCGSPYPMLWGGFRVAATSGEIEYGCLEIAGNDFIQIGIGEAWFIIAPPNPASLQKMLEIYNRYVEGLDLATGGSGNDVKMVLANLHDLSLSPYVQFVYPGLTAEHESNFRQHVEVWNANIAALAATRGMPVLSLWDWYEDARTNGLNIGGVDIDVMNPAPVSNDPATQANFYAADGLHPTPIASALIGNHFLQAIIDHYGETSVTPLTDQEMLLVTHLVPELFELNVSIVNEPWGSVLVDPNLPAYPPDHEVTLTAQPGEGRTFQRWEIYDPNYPGDANHAVIDANLTITIVMNADQEVAAVFGCGSGVVLPAVMTLALMGLGMVTLLGRSRSHR